MKKQIAIIAMLTLSIGASAQLRTSRTVFTQPKEEKVKVKVPTRMDWYVKAGLSINNLSLDDYSQMSFDDQYPQIGFAIDGGFNRYFNGSDFYWGAELGLGTSGTEIHGNIWDDYDSSFASKFSAYNIQLTPKVGYMVPLASDCAIDFHAGPYVAWDFVRHATDSWDWDFCGPVQAGAQVGVGVWYKKFNFDASFQYGFLYQGDAEREYLIVEHWYDVNVEHWNVARLELETGTNIRLRIGYAF